MEPSHIVFLWFIHQYLENVLKTHKLANSNLSSSSHLERHWCCLCWYGTWNHISNENMYLKSKEEGTGQMTVFCPQNAPLVPTVNALYSYSLYSFLLLVLVQYYYLWLLLCCFVNTIIVILIELILKVLFNHSGSPLWTNSCVKCHKHKW